MQLNYFSKEDSEKLIASIDSLATNCTIPSLITKQIKDGNGHYSSDTSITKIWEEEFARNISNTTFVPLDSGSMLQSERIRIIKQLSGHGKTASYLGRFLERQLVVIKEVAIPPAGADTVARQTYEQFQREYSYLLKLNHPRIARVLDYFVENNRNYLLLEFIPGTDLRQLVHDGGALAEIKYAIGLAK